MTEEQVIEILNNFFNNCQNDIKNISQINQNRIFTEPHFQTMFYHYIRTKHENLYIQTEASYPEHLKKKCDLKLSDGQQLVWIEQKIVAYSNANNRFQAKSHNKLKKSEWKKEIEKKMINLHDEDIKVFLLWGFFDFLQNTTIEEETCVWETINEFFDNNPANGPFTILEGFDWHNNRGSFSLNAYAWYKFV